MPLMGTQGDGDTTTPARPPFNAAIGPDTRQGRAVRTPRMEIPARPGARLRHTGATPEIRERVAAARTRKAGKRWRSSCSPPSVQIPRSCAISFGERHEEGHAHEAAHRDWLQPAVLTFEQVFPGPSTARGATASMVATRLALAPRAVCHCRPCELLVRRTGRRVLTTGVWPDPGQPPAKWS
jgi:hypothetical protein